MSIDDISLKRIGILRAAEEVMSEQGRQARVSEIASRAEVPDSIIYHYYKNKEDLLFSVAEERINESIEELQQHLQGIRDPVSKLSKMIWWQLHRHDTRKHFSNIVLFQCRSCHDFYRHSAFERIQQIRRIFMGIIAEGMAQGVFRSDLKIQAVRDITFGLMDLECIMCLAAGEIQIAHGDLDGIMDHILPMLSPRDTSAGGHSDKSHRILDAAEKVFAEKGYERATIKGIAALAGVGDGTVYQYFRNKEDLLYSTIEEGFRMSPFTVGFQEHLGPPDAQEASTSALGRLSRFVRQLFLLCLARPWFTRVLVLHGIFNREFYASRAYVPFRRYAEGLYTILEQGKAEGTVRPGVNNRIVRNMIFGAFSHLALRWIFAENEARFDKAKEINDTVRLLISAVATDASVG